MMDVGKKKVGYVGEALACAEALRGLGWSSQEIEKILSGPERSSIHDIKVRLDLEQTLGAARPPSGTFGSRRRLAYHLVSLERLIETLNGLFQAQRIGKGGDGLRKLLLSGHVDTLLHRWHPSKRDPASTWSGQACSWALVGLVDDGYPGWIVGDFNAQPVGVLHEQGGRSTKLLQLGR